MLRDCTKHTHESILCKRKILTTESISISDMKNLAFCLQINLESYFM